MNFNTNIARFAAAAGVLLALTSAATPSVAEDRRVRIINETSHTMLRFYASNVDTDDWEEDILGRGVLRSGQSVVVNIDDGSGHCMFDFKAVFNNGQELIRNNVNVCRISFYRYED